MGELGDFQGEAGMIAEATTRLTACVSRRRTMWGVILFLGCAVAALYGQVYWFDFVTLDDRAYVLENRLMQVGFTGEGVRLAFTSLYAGNWHPLTWLSLMLDHEVFGWHAGGYHVVNVVLHLVNTLLVYYVLLRMTGAMWPSAFVAAAFAVHPLHVESVAWVTARKDVLSGLFWMLTMLAYVRYTERASWRRYLLVMAAFALGLMAKPTVVTLPCVLLLLDIWPLWRLDLMFVKTGDIARRAGRLVMEKAPLFALSLAGATVTLAAQHASGATASVEALSMRARLFNASVSYVKYVVKTLLPFGLSPFYPHPGEGITVWQAAGSAALLVGISAIALWYLRRRPYLAVGWLWFLGALVPVIGIVQVGGQAMADRYMYLPLIGLFLVMAWGTGDLVRSRFCMFSCGLSLLLFWMVLAWVQTSHWRDAVAISERMLKVTPDSHFAHNSMGDALMTQNKPREAASHFAEAVRLRPTFPTAYNNLGVALAMQEDYAAALRALSEAVRLKPDYARAHANKGNVLLRVGRIEEARQCFEEALRYMSPLEAGRGILENAVKELAGFQATQADLDCK